ncbi:MAG TPA: DUF2336 domain-containing protein [Rhizomicrobium sp.]
MGLTATAFGDIGRLAALADNPHVSRREDIYCAVASLYQTQGGVISDRERELMREILRRLTGEVEMAIRIAAAERIADDPQAPLDLILFLVDDTIEVARPLILRSARLSDEELLRFVREADVARQAVCAQRPHIGETLTEVLAQSDAEPVLVALIRNATARIAEKSFALLVEKSRAIAALQEPLAQRFDLPPHLAGRMCEWVSEALKAHIVRHYQMSVSAASQALTQATRIVQAPSQATDGSHKLIEKLAAASQLKAGFLVRVLSQGQVDLFELAFAKLLELEPTRLKRLIYDGGPRSVALACRAVGIDKCVFPTVYNLSRQARRVHPQLTPHDRADADAVFATFSKAEALARVQSCD